MRLNHKLLGLAFTVIAGGALVSCSNELNENALNETGNGTFKLIKNPKVVAWSGNQTLSDTYTTRDINTIPVATRDVDASKSNNIFTVKDVEDEWPFDHLYDSNANTSGPSNIIYHLGGILESWIDNYPSWIKKEWVVEDYGQEGSGQVQFPQVIKDKVIGIENLNTEFTFDGKSGLNFTVYPYQTAATDQTHEIGLFYLDAQNGIHKVKLYDKDPSKGYNYEDGKIKGVNVTLNKNVKFGFYFTGRNDMSSVPTPEQLDTTYYSLPEFNDYRKHETDKTKAYNQHAGIVPYDRLPENFGTIICLEDWVDFDFDDFILFIPNINLEVVSPGDSITNDDLEEEPKLTCDKTEGCGNAHHSQHDGNVCEDCINEGIEGGCLGETCPNRKPEVEGSGCDHAPGEHHWDSSNNKWVCDTCEEGESECNPETQTPSTGGEGSGQVEEDPELEDGGSEVEINLSINDYNNQGDIANLISKLSIHVRYAHDVKVTIPMPAKYYIDQDDLLIFNTHEIDVFEGGSSVNHQATYHVDNFTVTLTVAYDKNANDGEGAITVTTSGISQELLDYCIENYGDGLNFEIYNYYKYQTYDEENENWSVIDGNGIEDLKQYLDRATVEFVDYDGHALASSDLYPNYYINAFGARSQYHGHEGDELPDYMEGTYTPSIENDCTVSIVEGQEGWYDNGKEGTHLNGTDKNMIFKKGGDDNSETNQHSHGFLWDKYKAAHPSTDGDEGQGE